MCFQREMASTPVRYVHFDIPVDEAYSLDSVGKHGFGEKEFIIHSLNYRSASHTLTGMSAETRRPADSVILKHMFSIIGRDLLNTDSAEKR